MAHGRVQDSHVKEQDRQQQDAVNGCERVREENWIL
jgi:hypothetical protein